MNRDVWTFLIACLIGAGAALLLIGRVRFGAVGGSGEKAAAETAEAYALAPATYGEKPLGSGINR